MSVRSLSAGARLPARAALAARVPSAGPAQRALALAALVAMLATILVHAVSAADPAPPVRRLDPAAARRGGVALVLTPSAEPPLALLEVRAADGGQFGGTVLDVAPGGGMVAVADVPAPARTAAVLVLAGADGSQMRLGMQGLLAATFAPDGRRLAAVDGRGRLWAVDATTGVARAVADGPFIDAPLVEADGTMIALAVSSVEAPFRSQLVAVDPGGNVTPLSAEELVYDAVRLADGSLIAVVHRPEGTALARVSGDLSAPFAALGPDAVNVSLSRDGGVIAWESAGRILVRVGQEPGADIGPGSHPEVSPDGASILVQRDGASMVVDLEGRPLRRVAAASAFLDCAEGCQP
jgi:hypothetical protein